MSKARVRDDETEAAAAVDNPEARLPNLFFSADGQLFLLRCGRCGRENHACAVAAGFCAWCRWNDPLDNTTDAALHELDDPQVLAELFGEKL